MYIKCSFRAFRHIVLQIEIAARKDAPYKVVVGIHQMEKQNKKKYYNEYEVEA